MTNLALGRIPPHDIEIEKAVLGAIMLERERLTDAASIIPYPECFYAPNHEKIYEAILSLIENGSHVDLLTVTHEISKSGEQIEGNTAYYLTQLTISVVNTSKVEEYSRIIIENYMRREMIRLAGDMINQAYDKTEDVFDIHELFTERLFAVMEAKSRNSWQNMKQVARDYLQEREDKRNGKTFISTTSPKLDRMNGGFKPSQVIILAARPAIGKSAYVLPIIKQTAANGVSVGVINYEMSNTQTFQRLLSQESSIDHRDIENGYNVGEDMIIRYSNQLSGLPVYFSKSYSMNINDIKASVTWLKSKADIGLLIIDYLQLIESPQNRSNREQEIAKISRGLKTLAMSLQIPIIALSQLNRDCEKRGDKRPNIADLRESGSLEQDADIVLLLHRDYAMGIETDAQGNSTEYQADLAVAKWRNGATGNIKFHFNPPTMKFTDMELHEKPTFSQSEPPHNTFKSIPGSYHPPLTQLPTDWDK